MTRHWETVIYGYATALLCGARWTAENLASLRVKCLQSGHTEGECLLIERDPLTFIRRGWRGYGEAVK